MTLLGIAVGGALGAVLRWWLGELAPSGDGSLWTTLAINVTGSALLAALPAVTAVRRRPALAGALGPGVLGGFTTLSATSEQLRMLLAADRSGAAGLYLFGTLSACLLAVALVSRLSTPTERDIFEAEGGDE